jgi:DNA-binding NtrC family response regulator
VSKRRDGDIRQALGGLRGGPGAAVLIVEPNPDRQSAMARLVAVHGHRAIGTSSIDGARALMEAFPVDLVLLAEELGGGDPVRVVGELVSLQPNARIVVLTQPEEPGSGVRPARFRALEYQSRPVNAATLQALLAS